MKQLRIYEPAMCCSTGLCGVGIDPELMRMATVLDNLQKNGVDAKRFNLNSAPIEFINNSVVNKLINERGTDVLPLMLVDNEVVISQRYPTNAELIMHLNISPEFLEAPKKKQEACCEEGSGCCDNNESNCCGGNNKGCC